MEGYIGSKKVLDESTTETLRQTKHKKQINRTVFSLTGGIEGNM
jgi:hypothetical protein